MSLTIGQRRALSQRHLRAGDLARTAHESDVQSQRSMSMLVGVIFAVAFVLLCAVAGIKAADWWSGGAAFVASVPAGAECVR